MRFFLALFLAATLVACGNSKETGSEATDNSENAGETSVRPAISKDGVIVDQTSTDGCGFMIKVQYDDAEKILDPGELDEEFKVDGLEVTVKYNLSRRQTTCTGTLPIVLAEIKKK